MYGRCASCLALTGGAIMVGGGCAFGTKVVGIRFFAAQIPYRLEYERSAAVECSSHVLAYTQDGFGCHWMGATAI